MTRMVIVERPLVVPYILYVSVATYPPSDQQLLGILDGARLFNSGHDLTGLLLYHSGRFMQLLEGPIGQLETLYARIETDPRHHSVTIICCGERERQFPGWSMGFENVTHWRPPRYFSAVSEIFCAPFDPAYFGAHPTEAQQLILSFRGAPAL